MKNALMATAVLSATLGFMLAACRRDHPAPATPRAPPVRADRFQGEGRALLAIHERDGRPASGRTYRIEYDDRASGPLLVREGTADDEGHIAIEDLAPLGYQVLVDGERLGAFSYENAQDVAAQTFTMPPMAGDPAPELRAIDLATGATVTLAAFTGQVVWLDFWATWCGPCREPIAQVNALAAKRGAEWGGRVAFVAVSLDDDAALVRRTVLIRDLTSLRQLWAGTGSGRRWESDAAVAYGIREIPTGLLIDRAGRIAWRGSPADFPLEREIERLLEQP